MVWFELFLAFFGIGLTSFGGGYATLPMIQEIIVEQYHWLSMSEITDIISISQMTPGPIAINAATFVGSRIAGVPGALLATFSNVLPQTIILTILGYFMFRGKKIKFMDYALNGLRPGVVGLIAAACITIVSSAVFSASRGAIANESGVFRMIWSFLINKTDVVALITFSVAMFMRCRKISVAKVMIMGAFVGAVGAVLQKFVF